MKKLLSGLFLVVFISCEAHCCWDIGVRGDLLYWTTCQSDLDYTLLRNFEGQTNALNVPLRGSKKFLDYGWDVGFRMDVQGSRCGERLLNFSWTQFHPGTKSSLKPCDVDEYATLIHFHPDRFREIALSRQAKATIKQKYDSFDFLVGSFYHANSCVSLSTKMGVRFLTLDQTLKVVNKDLLTGISASPSGDALASYTFDLWGAGLHSALEARVELGCQTHFFTQIGLSILASEVKGKVKQTLTEFNPDIVDVIFKANGMLPGTDISIGLGTYWACSECVNLHLDVAYEAVYWHETPKDMRFFDRRMVSGSALYSGNTLFHGLTLKAHLRF